METKVLRPYGISLLPGYPDCVFETIWHLPLPKDVVNCEKIAIEYSLIRGDDPPYTMETLSATFAQVSRMAEEQNVTFNQFYTFLRAVFRGEADKPLRYRIELRGFYLSIMKSYEFGNGLVETFLLGPKHTAEDDRLCICVKRSTELLTKEVYETVSLHDLIRVLENKKFVYKMQLEHIIRGFK